VDAILYTHAHADHVMGLDEVRRFNAIQDGPIPCYASAPTWEDLRSTFSYVFNPAPRKEGGGVPKLQPHTIDGPFSVGGVRIVPVPLWHGSLPILGFRFGNFAYLTDCNRLDDDAWPLVQGVDTLVIDALRYRPHSTHFSIDEAIGAAARIAARRVYFTHMCHDLGYAETNARLPAGVELAYDGLVLDVEVDAS
jgi:phosphoribosyl 1,2-cyclic phosphate phosphodiesterase